MTPLPHCSSPLPSANTLAGHILLKIIFLGVYLLYSATSFYCLTKWISWTYTYIPLFFNLSHSDPHRALRRVPCAMQQLLISYLFHQQCQLFMHVNPNLPTHPTPLPLWSSQACYLHLCLYFCFANWLICTVFPDSTYKH